MHYVYIYADPMRDMEPIYVGKGRGDRARHHLRKRSENPLLRGKIQRLRDSGHEPRVTIINVITEALALDIERQLVAIHGRIHNGTGTLCNLTAGGDGYAVGRLSDEHREKIAASLRGRVRTESHRTNLSAVNRGKRHSPETIEKLRLLAQAKAADPEFRRSMSAKLKGRKLSPEQVAQRTQQLCAARAAKRAASPQSNEENTP